MHIPNCTTLCVLKNHAPVMRSFVLMFFLVSSEFNGGFDSSLQIVLRRVPSSTGSNLHRYRSSKGLSCTLQHNVYHRLLMLYNFCDISEFMSFHHLQHTAFTVLYPLNNYILSMFRDTPTHTPFLLPFFQPNLGWPVAPLTLNRSPGVHLDPTQV